MKKLVSFVAATVLANATIALAEEGADNDALIAEALSAAPAFITDDATVHNWQHQTLREGSNGWVCLPTMPALAEAGKNCPMCVDATWHGFFVDLLAGAEKPTITVMGMSYMIAGDCGVSNIDPAATEPTDDNQWIVEGPHLMVLFPDNSILDDYSDDPFADGPYVMWNETPWEHLMIPLGGREEE